MVVNALLNLLGPTIDMIWVGKLGPAAIAGVGVAGIAVQMLMSATMGLMMGMRALIARAIGAGDPEAADRVTMQAFVLSIAFAGVMALVGIFLTERILGLFGLDEEVVVQGAAYLRIMFVGAVVMTARIVAESGMQAAGDATTPMWLAVFFRTFHVILAPFLILGLWIFPRMGVSGAATTNIISQGIALVFSLWFLFKGRSLYFAGRRWPFLALGTGRLKPTLQRFRVDLTVIRRIVRIGIPASVMGMQIALGQFVLIKAISPFGMLALAAHAVSQRVEIVLVMPVLGLGMAAGVLAGQNLGAGKPHRAERSGWLAAGLAEAWLVVFCLVLLVLAEPIFRVFNAEPALVLIGADFLRIAAAGYAFIGVVIVLQSCLSGAGDTVWAMIFSLLIMWGVQVPLAFVLPEVTDLGVYGVRWAMVIAMAVGAVAYMTYFRMGRWKRRQP